MDAGHGDELVLVARRPRLALEFGNGGVVQVLLSVEGRRAVLRQQLVRVFLLDRLGEVACFVRVGPGSFAPDHVGVPDRSRVMAWPELWGGWWEDVLKIGVNIFGQFQMRGRGFRWGQGEVQQTVSERVPFWLRLFRRFWVWVSCLIFSLDIT